MDDLFEMDDHLDFPNLKKALFEAMCGPGGLGAVLDELAKIADEMATDADIRDDLAEVKKWQTVAKAIRRASQKALPLLKPCN